MNDLALIRETFDLSLQGNYPLLENGEKILEAVEKKKEYGELVRRKGFIKLAVMVEDEIRWLTLEIQAKRMGYTVAKHSSTSSFGRESSLAVDFIKGLDNIKADKSLDTRYETFKIVRREEFDDYIPQEVLEEMPLSPMVADKFLILKKRVDPIIVIPSIRKFVEEKKKGLAGLLGKTRRIFEPSKYYLCLFKWGEEERENGQWGAGLITPEEHLSRLTAAAAQQLPNDYYRAIMGFPPPGSLIPRR